MVSSLQGNQETGGGAGGGGAGGGGGGGGGERERERGERDKFGQPLLLDAVKKFLDVVSILNR
eukprot:438093-Hanusia_phi.AAC.1